MAIKEALFKLDDFCNANKIEYMVTGTVALAMLGVPSNPNDIDIKVFHLKENQEAKLKELQFLAGLDKENYEGGCYSFTISGIKVNALVDNVKSYDGVLPQEVTIDLIDKNQAKHRLINIQPVFPALMDKMKLRRDKDKTYMLNLINKLSSL
jgi:hypothetical protein